MKNTLIFQSGERRHFVSGESSAAAVWGWMGVTADRFEVSASYPDANTVLQFLLLKKQC